MPSKILERRLSILEKAKQLTEEQGFFTIPQLSSFLGMPRTTVADWVSRLVREGHFKVLRPSSARKPATYAYVFKEVLPISPCKRIFALADSAHMLVELCHECLSFGAMCFCQLEYQRSSRLLLSSRIEGSFLRLRMKIGKYSVDVGPPPKPALGVESIELLEGFVKVIMKAYGGAAHSLMETMPRAKGVVEISVKKEGDFAVGELLLKSYVRIAVGVDDTDSSEEGATWALTLDVARRLCEKLGEDAILLSHKVVALDPLSKWRTAGNYASLVEVALHPSKVSSFLEAFAREITEQSLSSFTGVAWLQGLYIPQVLRQLGFAAKKMEIPLEKLESVCKEAGVKVLLGEGKRGCVGAVAALSFVDDVEHALKV
ncbi:MAG: hypothetical protein J7L98_00725 [Candidatus Verstraetearchaeota archaeon]|nr:hypothetical protein [Candidatus Verstraetearchaeota archaeon]